MVPRVTLPQWHHDFVAKSTIQPPAAASAVAARHLHHHGRLQISAGIWHDTHVMAKWCDIASKRPTVEPIDATSELNSLANEAKWLSNIQYPGIVQLICIITDTPSSPNTNSSNNNDNNNDGMIVGIATRYIDDSMNISEWLRTSPSLTMFQRCHVSYGLCSILAYLESHGMLHGDIQWQNVIIQPKTLTLFLCDFEHASSTQTDKKISIKDEDKNDNEPGSPGYAATTMTSDLYSYGQCLQQLWTFKDIDHKHDNKDDDDHGVRLKTIIEWCFHPTLVASPFRHVASLIAELQIQMHMRAHASSSTLLS
jgi:serine/threonine protein kinase